MARSIAIIGDSIAGVQSAFALAQMGVEVKVITPSIALGLNSNLNHLPDASSQDLLLVWPLLLQTASHPRVSLYTNSEVESVDGERGGFRIRVTQHPRYVREDICTSCGRCQEECSVKVTSIVGDQKVTHGAIHAPLFSAKGVPSAYTIDKKGIAPCRAACPLGINVQGFVSLLANGKTDRALSLIVEAAPLPSVLGRVCTQPCESKCMRAEVDSPVFIRALHRYAADHAPGGIKYSRKAPAGSRKEKVAIVGSGPAGLAAAWELARRGYTPTIFESHSVVGGMLATGIPRFRLPREVREREIEAIKTLGVDIRTSTTVGQDVTFANLKEEGYQAFFISIGAQQNNKLNIPGEELEGVRDSVSLLLRLNLKIADSVGSKVVVIGGGNIAIDAARAAKRKSKGEVQILYRRTAEEMTAIKEEVEEALMEGVSIQYLTVPLEILGDGTMVTGIRCQRMRLGKRGADRRRNPKPIPGSEFVLDADEVVVAIGQSPETSMLKLEKLEINNDGSIKVDPPTLSTNLPGVFSGGDCVTGPNNVVEAVAAGLRAAESIDRYLRGLDLREGRSLERPQPVEPSINESEIPHQRRAHMPTLHLERRIGTFEETTTGLSMEVATKEAERCLSCALCSECLECEQVCELGAVFHGDATKEIEIEADMVLDFASAKGIPDNSLPNDAFCQQTILQSPRPGFYAAPAASNGSLWGELARASAIALKVVAELELKPEELYPDRSGTSRLDSHPAYPQREAEPGHIGKARTGVFLCRCGGSINSVIDFKEIAAKVSALPDVCCVQEVPQTCTEEGAGQIAAQASELGINRVVLAACRCCSLEQICYSCTDRRVMCQHHLGHSLALSSGTLVKFVNIREQCAWVHKDNPSGATRKAIAIVSSGIAQARNAFPIAREERPIVGSVLVIGRGLSALATARDLAIQGYLVTLLSESESERVKGKQSLEYLKLRSSLVKQLEEQGIGIKPLPNTLELGGSPGSYEILLRYGSRAKRIGTGAIVIDLSEVRREKSFVFRFVSKESLLGQLIARQGKSNGLASTDSAALKVLAIKDTSGIFIIPSNAAKQPEEMVLQGAATAVRVSAYLVQGRLSPPVTAVTINSKLCRGCGDCAAICPYIEMRDGSNGKAYAYIEPALCLGCGACIAHCPTGAITQPLQGDREIISVMEALLEETPKTGGKQMNQSMPSIVVFACNWDGLSCVETAGQLGLSYPTSVKVVRVSCLSRVHSGLILKAFELGADGVMLLGCEPGNCHFDISAECVRQEYRKAKEILDLLGMGKGRVVLAHMSRGDGLGFVSRVTSFIEEIWQMQHPTHVRA